MGTTGFAAQAYGADNHQASRQLMAQSLLMAGLIGLCILFASPWLLELGLSLIAPPASAQSLASSYCQIRIFSAPAVLITYAIVGWLIGHQNTRSPLYIVVFTNSLNIVLDIFLIIGLELNSDGAAWATLIAEYAGCGLAIYFLCKQLHPMGAAINWSQLKSLAHYKPLLNVNRHLFIRTLTLLASFAFFTAQGASMGETILAANAILMHFVLLASYGMDGFTHASEALIGDALGKKNHSLFMQCCITSGRWSLLTALLFSMAFLLTGNMLLTLFSSIPEVINTAQHYLPWLIVLPLFAMASYWLDGIFIGATQSKAMQNSMLFSTLCIYLPSWYLTQSWGNHGLWFAFTAFNIGRGLTLGLCFFRYNKFKIWHR